MFKGVSINNAFYKLIFLLALGCYILIIVKSLEKPLVADELANRSAAESVVLIGAPKSFGLDRLLLGHPPLYLYTVAVFFRIFGIGDIQARLVGLAFFVLNLILVFMLGKSLYPKNKLAAPLALLFFGLSPLVIQGFSIIDIDQTLLAFTLTLFFYCFIRFEHLAIQKRIIFLSLSFFLVMCSKFSPIPMLIASMMLYWGLKRNFLRGVVEVAAIVLLGAGLFLLSWRLFCYYFHYNDYFLEPFIYTYRSFFRLQAEGGLLEKLVSAGISLLRISSWISPFLLLLAFYVLGKQVKELAKERPVQRDFFLSIFVFGSFIGYLFVGGLSYGFPKSQFPVMPALAVLIGGNLSLDSLNKSTLTKLAVILCIVLLGYLLLVGDTIYLINYSLKEALIYNFRLGFANFIFPLLLYIVSPLLLLGIIHILFRSWVFTHKFLFALIITTLASNLSLDILQANADYLTTAGYGGRGKIAMLNFLKGILREDDIVFSAPEIIYDLRSSKSVFPYLETWSRPESFLAFIREEKPRAIIYGIPLNTIGEFKRTLLRPGILELLKRDYKREDFGSYTVWVRETKK
ncbi:MAG: glycosyltransferase family 39 protein [Candidatus Omnitrophica bacterium]|nr:glycosyltransferase family 39 protein [Candidatus Omnitrophota bacterium]